MSEDTRGAATRSVAILLTVLCVAYAVEPLLSTNVYRRDIDTLLIGAAGLAAFCVTLVRVVWHGTQTIRRGKPWDLVAAGIIAFAMCLRFGPAVAALPALVGGAASFTLTRYRAVAIVLLTVASVSVITTNLGVPVVQVVDLTGRSLIVMAVVYALGKAVVLNREIERNRAELARLAVLEERLRFSRDLHDVLGHSLSVIALKGEVAARLAGHDQQRAIQEMNAVTDIARRSVGDVRSVVRGYRRQSLEAEIEGAVSVLEAAGIHCVQGDVPTALSERTQEALGWVVREAVTNVLRHSDATQCSITFETAGGQAVLEITNDGVDCARNPPAVQEGQGLDGLAERMSAVGGDLSYERTSRGRFRLVASVPLPDDKSPTSTSSR